MASKTLGRRNIAPEATHPARPGPGRVETTTPDGVLQVSERVGPLRAAPRSLAFADDQGPTAPTAPWQPQTNAANPRLVDSPAAVVLQWWLLVSPQSISSVAAKLCPARRFFMSESLSLREASVQDLQLELLRRTCFNALDGERVLASLLKHRH